MSLYGSLKAHDQTAVASLVAVTAQAFEWDAGGLARWCALIGADPQDRRHRCGRSPCQKCGVRLLTCAGSHRSRDDDRQAAHCRDSPEAGVMPAADLDELHRDQGRHHAERVFVRCSGDPECTPALFNRLANAVLAYVIGEVRDIYNTEGISDPAVIDAATAAVRETYIGRLRMLIIAAGTPAWA